MVGESLAQQRIINFGDSSSSRRLCELLGALIKEDRMEQCEMADDQVKRKNPMDVMSRKLGLVGKICFHKGNIWPGRDWKARGEAVRIIPKIEKDLSCIYPDSSKIFAQNWDEINTQGEDTAHTAIVLCYMKELMGSTGGPRLYDDEPPITDEFWAAYLAYIREKVPATIALWEWDWASKVPRYPVHAGLTLTRVKNPEQVLRLESEKERDNLERG